jgi:putative hydrolase of the HAD superfamily
MIDALLLDLGNVLVFHDNEKLFDAMAKAFRSTREELRARLEGGLWDRVNRGQLPQDALRQELLARLGGAPSPDEWFALWNCHFTIHDEMVRVVERLVGQTKLVLVSNTHDQHMAWLRPRLPVLEQFDALVLSYEVGAVKPEPAIYRRALEAANVPPQRAAFFDDVQRYADAATALGLHGRLFTTVPRFLEDLRALGVMRG